MTQIIKNIFSILDNNINAIAVKEMRQAVRSRYIILLLQIYLFIEIIMTGFALFAYQGIGEDVGLTFFNSLIFILFIANIICVPIYTSNRLAREVQLNDAMFSTTLAPIQIVRGKVICGLTISLLLFSAALPFIIISYLMRGLDLSEILLTLYWTFLFIQLLNAYGILFGAIRISTVARVIVGLIMSGVLFGLFDSMPYGFSFVDFITDIELPVFFLTTIFILFLCELFINFAVSSLSPETYNRMTRARIFAFGCSVILMIASALIYSFTHDVSYIEVSMVFNLFFILFFLIIGLCERTSLSVRQIQQIPRNPVLRVLAFPFFTNVGSAIAWLMIMTGATLLFDVIYNNSRMLDSIITFDNGWSFIFVCLFYITIGMLTRQAVDCWRRETFAQHLPEDPSIVIYPSPQKGGMTFFYAILFLSIPVICSLMYFIIVTSSSQSTEDVPFVLNYFSPFYYLDYDYLSHDKTIFPRILGALSILVLAGQSVYSFIQYYFIYPAKLQENSLDDSPVSSPSPQK